MRNIPVRRINKIVIHCSDSPFGSAGLIDTWHKHRGWRCIGYHFVIRNAYPDQDSFRLGRPQFWNDGVVEKGRPSTIVGAHVRGHNDDSIGICLVGRNSFTHMQYQSLCELLISLKQCHPDAEIVGHYELVGPQDPLKTCPNIDMEWLRRILEQNTPAEQGCFENRFKAGLFR